MQNDAVLGRKKRIDIIKAAINRALTEGEYVLKDKLVANCCINMGLSRKTVEEYIDLIVVEQDLVEKGGAIRKNVKDND